MINLTLAKKVAKKLETMTWETDFEEAWEIIGELEVTRHGEGSRITTARTLLENLERPAVGPSVTLILEWLYYRR